MRIRSFELVRLVAINEVIARYSLTGSEHRWAPPLIEEGCGRCGRKDAFKDLRGAPVKADGKAAGQC